MADDDNWHLDKKVPITLIAAILFQTFGFGVYAANLNNRIANLERDNQPAHAELQKLEDARENTIRAVDALTYETKGLDKTLEALAAAVARIETSIRGSTGH